MKLSKETRDFLDHLSDRAKNDLDCDGDLIIGGKEDGLGNDLRKLRKALREIQGGAS